MARPSLLLLAVLLVPTVAAAQEVQPPAPNPAAVEARIDELIAARQFDEAVPLLRSALRDYPEYQGFMASALWLLEEASNGDRQQLLASLLEPAQEAAKAAKEAEAKAKRLDSEVNSLMLRLQYSRARSRLEEALREFPDHSGLLASASFLSFLQVAAWLLTGLILTGIAVGAVVLALAGWFRKPFAAASVYIVGIYLTSIPAALLLGIIGMNLSRLSAEQAPPESLRQVVIVILSCCLGALGGAIRCSFLLAAIDRDLPRRAAFRFFFYKPLNGFFLAGVMYVALMSGQLVLFGGPEVPSIWSVALLATLTGLLSDGALRWLQVLANMIFPPEEEEKERRREPEGADTVGHRADILAHPAAATAQEAAAAGG